MHRWERRTFAAAAAALILGHSVGARADSGAHVQLKAWENRSSVERDAWGTVVDPDSLPESVLKNCPKDAGSIVLTALHALVNGTDANPLPPYKVELTFDGSTPAEAQKIVVCAALPNRDQVLIQTKLKGSSKGASLAADDQKLTEKTKIDIGPVPNMAVQVSSDCPLSSLTCGSAFLPSPSGAASFQREAKVSGIVLKEQTTDSYNSRWNGLSGAPVRVGDSVVAILVSKLDGGALAVPASRKAFTEDMVVHDWKIPTLRDIKQSIAEVMRVGINDATTAPPSAACKLTDAYAGLLRAADHASWAWSNEGLRSEFRPKRRTLADVETALKAIGAAQAEEAGKAQPSANKCKVPGSLDTAVKSYLTALQYERLAGALSTLESVHMADEPQKIGLSPTGAPIKVKEPKADDGGASLDNLVQALTALQRCKAEGPKLSWIEFVLGDRQFWADPLTARVTCYMITHKDDGKERNFMTGGFEELRKDLIERPAKNTDPCMLFRSLRFAGVIDAKQDCTDDNKKIATTLWDAFKAPLGEQSWANNAGNSSQFDSLMRLFDRKEADGLIDVVGVFAMHRKWPLERTAGLVGPTIIEAMTERFRLLGRSSYGDYGLAPLPESSEIEKKAKVFRDRWQEVVTSLGLPTAAGVGEANSHAVARAFVRYQLRHARASSSSAATQDKIGTMAQEAAAMTNLAAAKIQAEVTALAP